MDIHNFERIKDELTKQLGNLDESIKALEERRDATRKALARLVNEQARTVGTTYITGKLKVTELRTDNYDVRVYRKNTKKADLVEVRLMYPSGHRDSSYAYLRHVVDLKNARPAYGVESSHYEKVLAEIPEDKREVLGLPESV